MALLGLLTAIQGRGAGDPSMHCVPGTLCRGASDGLLGPRLSDRKNIERIRLQHARLFESGLQIVLVEQTKANVIRP